VAKQDAVPLAIPNHIYQSTRATTDRRQKATGELALLAFFFLLRVGEYTYHGKKIRRTQQFRLQDLKFFAKDHAISLAQLKTRSWDIDLVSMTIDNQKNGKCGQILSHHAITDPKQCGCPVRALVEQTLDLLKDGATADTIICAYRDSPCSWQFVRSQDIVKVVKDAIPATKTNHRGYKKSKVGSHSL